MKKIFGEERVKIVVLNWFDYDLFDGSNFPMTGGGNWDAAFELLECRPFAIDLKIHLTEKLHTTVTSEVPRPNQRTSVGRMWQMDLSIMHPSTTM